MKRNKLVTSILAGVLVASALVVAGCTPKEGKPVNNAGEESSVVDGNNVQGTKDTDKVAESSPESMTDESTTEVSESDNSTNEASTEQTESLPDESSTENSTEVEEETLEREPNTVEDIESEKEIPSEEDVITDTTENNDEFLPSDVLPSKDDNLYPVLYYGCPNSKRVAKLVTKKAIKVVRG